MNRDNKFEEVQPASKRVFFSDSDHIETIVEKFKQELENGTDDIEFVVRCNNCVDGSVKCDARSHDGDQCDCIDGYIDCADCKGKAQNTIVVNVQMYVSLDS